MPARGNHARDAGGVRHDAREMFDLRTGICLLTLELYGSGRSPTRKDTSRAVHLLVTVHSLSGYSKWAYYPVGADRLVQADSGGESWRPPGSQERLEGMGGRGFA